jgi:hypothetical protein
LLALPVALALAVSASGEAAKPHHHHFTPKPGTYAGVGAAKAGGQRYEMRVVFRIKGGTVEVPDLLNNFPGCSTSASSGSGPLTGKTFDLITTGSFPTSRDIRGRFTDSRTIKGTMTTVYSGPSQCGTPGTYKYNWIAKRIGKP